MEEDTRPCLGVRGEDQVPDPKFSSAQCQDEPMLWEPDTGRQAVAPAVQGQPPQATWSGSQLGLCAHLLRPVSLC
jgi:hypothetical protein